MITMTISRLRSGLAVAVVACAVIASVGGRAQAEGALAFSGAAEARGIQLTFAVPGGPATDTPIDSGGPTAQAALDSIGTSTAYAAFPDPGGIVVSGPGLAAGFLAGGAGGLPPITFPASPPEYPLYVRSTSSTPDQSVGAGPYRLSTSSRASSSTAQASGGFQTDAVGNIATAVSSASVRTDQSGVVAEATSDVQGLTVGPLTIGEIKSSARRTMAPEGVTTPSTSLEITGLRIGTASVSITPQGLLMAGSTVPLPINETLARLLAPTSVTVELLAAQVFPDRVVAPAVKIVAPGPRGTGTMTLVIGGVSAGLSGVDQGGTTGDSELPPLPTAGPDLTSGGSLPGVGEATPAGATRTPTIEPTESTEFRPFPVSGESAAASDPAPTPAGSEEGMASPGPTAVVSPARSSAPIAAYDLRGQYVAVAIGAAMALLLGQSIRLLGVRRP